MADDLIGLHVLVMPGYVPNHPRLLFSGSDREALQRKAKEQPKLWEAVLANARSIKNPDAVPASDIIKSGAKYWRIEAVESGALAALITGDKAYRDGVARWLVAYCQEPIWGTLFRPNLDLAASWNLYHVSIAYDILYPELEESDRKIIREGLATHASAISADLDTTGAKSKIPYDQNHTYIPTVGLTAAALVLLGEVPEAQDWLNRSYAVLRRSRYVLGEDGYYYEGFGYWAYALHWHVRAAELLERATGEKMFDLPALRDNWLYALHLHLPGTPGAFNIHDSELWDSNKPRPDIKVTNATMLWGIASANSSPESQTAGDLYNASQPEKDYPSAAFLWFNPSVKARELDQIKPFHYFRDHDVIAWRSSWKPDATCYLFRCGPPLGHSAAAKLEQLKDWKPNAGHVHPNIGAIWMYAKGTFLAVETGYTAQKWTRDHNTLLIDGKGQGADGTYHNERGVPYKDLDQARIDSSYLGESYGYASGEFGTAYARQVPDVKLRRSILMTERWALIIDDMHSAKEHQLTWLCHADATFEAKDGAYIANLPKASLAIIPLTPFAMEPLVEKTVVMSGATIGEMVPDKGKPLDHGYHLGLTMAKAAKDARLINLLVPLSPGAKPPTVESMKLEKEEAQLVLKWPEGKIERVRLNLGWRSNSEDPAPTPSGPADISVTES